MNPDDDVTISVKVHGISGCFAKVHVKEKINLPFMKNLFNKFVDYTGLFKKHRITDYKVVYGPVYSSRTVIKNRYINNKVNSGSYKNFSADQAGYGLAQWTSSGRKSGLLASAKNSSKNIDDLGLQLDYL